MIKKEVLNMEERKVSEEMLAKVSGGALKEEDKDGIICWLRARKDFGESFPQNRSQFRVSPHVVFEVSVEFAVLSVFTTVEL